MPNKQGHTAQSLPASNYSAAVARAVEWLGDRYLLAKPINSSRLLRGQPHAAEYRRHIRGAVEN